MMSKAGTLTGSVLVVMDPDYGERLRQRWPGQPVWITMSPVNEPTVRSLWASHPGQHHLSGITSFPFDSGAPPEKKFLDYLEDIDLHHGPYSNGDSYTTLEVIGARPTTDVRQALGELGFDEFDEHADGFTARRSPEEAAKLGD